MKKRIISGIIMILICVPLMLIGGIPFMVAMGILGVLAYKELIDLKGEKNYPKSVIVCGLISMLILIYANNLQKGIIYDAQKSLFDYMGLNYRFILLSIMLMFMPVVFNYNSGKYTVDDAFRLSSMVIFLGTIIGAGMNLFLYEKGAFILILIVCLATDISAYLVGRAIGKHKITKISPKKSLEGFIGGAIMGTAVGVIYYIGFINVAPIYIAIPVILTLSLTCEIGDLFYSAIKRERGIKDFSKLIPGHGGILDRIDSMTFVTAMYLILYGLI